tara:strand:- start:1959 stop:3239 length:1281 start_codon:yes stop_codon:yes gene_type:complete
MISIYRFLTTIIYPFLVIFIILRIFFNKEDSSRYKEKIFFSHFKVSRKTNTKLIWFHAASIGELKSIIPIIKELNKNDKTEFLVTTITLSSSNLALEEFKKFENIYHRFLPLDVNFLIKRFIRLWKPDKIFLVDSEIWPNLIIEANSLKIPLALINARITSKTFKKWMKFPETAKVIFSKFNLFICSNNETKNYLEKLNLKNIFFIGNIKFISDLNEKKIEISNKDFLLNRRFWFAASVHKDEDIFCLQTHINLKKKLKDIVTIIAPRHVDRSKQIRSLSEKLQLETQILNKNDNILQNKEIIIINHFGGLKKYFKYAKSVFIGKSTVRKLISDGGQNPIEAAKLNCKVYHGPYVYNFKEIYEILKKNNISKEIHNSKELSDNLITDLENFYVKDKNISNSIKMLSEKTLIGTMKIVCDFVNYDVK